MEKMSKKEFEEKFEIVFGSEETLNSGTSNVLFNQKQAFIKDKKTGEIRPTEIYASSEDFGELLVIEKFCNPE